jgi:hypothetical protein
LLYAYRITFTFFRFCYTGKQHAHGLSHFFSSKEKTLALFVTCRSYQRDLTNDVVHRLYSKKLWTLMFVSVILLSILNLDKYCFTLALLSMYYWDFTKFSWMCKTYHKIDIDITHIIFLFHFYRQIL